MKNNIILVICASLILSICSAAWGGEIGAPEPYSKERSFSLGLGSSCGTSRLNGDNDFDMKQNQIYVEGLYRWDKNAESYLRLGAADARISDVTPEFNGDYSFMLSAGARWLMYSDGTFGIGPFIQTTDTFPEFKDGTLKIKDAQDIALGFGLQAHIGPAIIYAGPFAYWARARLEDSDTTTNVRQKNILCGYGGLRLTLPYGFHSNIEGQYKGGSTLALSIGKSF